MVSIGYIVIVIVETAESAQVENYNNNYYCDLHTFQNPQH